jgi:hypothetical protein
MRPNSLLHSKIMPVVFLSDRLPLFRGGQRNKQRWRKEIRAYYAMKNS